MSSNTFNVKTTIRTLDIPELDLHLSVKTIGAGTNLIYKELLAKYNDAKTSDEVEESSKDILDFYASLLLNKNARAIIYSIPIDILLDVATAIMDVANGREPKSTTTISEDTKATTKD